jgi:hypothetical protein
MENISNRLKLHPESLSSFFDVSIFRKWVDASAHLDLPVFREEAQLSTSIGR